MGIAALALAAFEAMAGAAARAVRDGTAQDSALSLVSNLPGGPSASLRCVSAIAGAAIIAAASAEAGAGWGLEWGLILLVAALALAAVAGVSFGARTFGARFARPIAPAACRAAWLLAFPFKPVLLIHERLSAAKREEAGGAVVEFHDEPFDEYELEMIRGVVLLDKTVSEDIMTQRGDIAFASVDATLRELADIMVTAGHSRIPVCEEDNLDKIIGVAHARDLLPVLADGEDQGKTAGDIARRSPLFIPESKTLEDLLKEFQETRNHMALVVDEYGGVSGIVTIEDLLEEIVGEIRDEFDEGEREPPAAVPISDSEYTVDADFPLDDFSNELGVEIVGNGFKTVGGLVIHKLGRIPVAGDKVEYGGLTIEVESAAARRPRKLKVKRGDGGDGGGDE